MTATPSSRATAARVVRPRPDSAATGMTAIAVAVLLVLGAVTWGNSVRGAFVFDDDVSVVQNASIRRLSWEAVFGPPRRLMAGRLIPNFTLAVNYALGGLDPTGYHVFNVAVHVAAALVLFGVVRRTLSRARLPAALAGTESWLALAVAAVWLVHPLQTDAVTYVTQRTELLMGLCYLVTLYAAIRAWDAPWPWTAIAVGAVLLGIACKEIIVSAPILVVLWDLVFRAPLREAWARRRVLWLGLLATWPVLAAFVVLMPRTELIGFDTGVGPLAYACTELGIVLDYLRLALWPTTLNIDHGVWVAHTAREIVPPALGIAGLLGATLVALCRRPAVGFCGAWLFLILAPTSTVLPIPTEVMAERRMYLPLAAVVALVVVGAAALGARLVADPARRRVVAAGLLAIVVAVLGALTVRRNALYASEQALLTDALAKTPENFRAHANMGTLLTDAGRLDEAASHLEAAIRLEPRFTNAYYNLGNVRMNQERWDDAIRAYRAALHLDPAHAEAHANLGTALLTVGRLDDATAEYAEALRLAPDVAAVHNNLGTALREQGRPDAAIAEYREAVRLAPAVPLFRQNLDDALARRDRG